MSELYLLRHAKAAPQHDGGDRGRPLEQRGRRAAESVAAWIADHKISPELVLCSPAIRTRQTLDIVSPAFARPPEIRIEDNLYLATARQLLTRLRQLSSGLVSVMLVGHNPGFHELANYLSDVASGPLSARIAAGFPTAALARYETDVDWSALDRRLARLVAFLVPTELIRGTD
jgi:phosphohistidine phosphatase